MKYFDGMACNIRTMAEKVRIRTCGRRRNRALKIWPDEFTLFVIIAAAFTALASHFDGHIAIYMKRTDSFIFAFLRSVTDAAKSHYYLIPAALIMTTISACDWRCRALQQQKLLIRSYERAAFIFASILGPGIIVNIIKQFIGRGRPHTMDEFGPYIYSPFEFTHIFQSFPSGHSATAGSIGMIIALYIPAIRWPVLFFFAVLAFARVTANAHYLSDVITGYCFGALATLVLARWLASRATMFHQRPWEIFPNLKC
jgi:undecaprenyl-diphosphatase